MNNDECLYCESVSIDHTNKEVNLCMNCGHLWDFNSIDDYGEYGICDRCNGSCGPEDYDDHCKECEQIEREQYESLFPFELAIPLIKNLGGK
jgi:hypothetical protein|tara:strand:+ start:38 stop:313 length:276 start_codon:yes stop_codon:yes gene_type:complete